jgi:hypothetical protein
MDLRDPFGEVEGTVRTMDGAVRVKLIEILDLRDEAQARTAAAELADGAPSAVEEIFAVLDAAPVMRRLRAAQLREILARDLFQSGSI